MVVPALYILTLGLFHLFTTCIASTTELAGPVKPRREDYIRICPLPKCDTCPSAGELRAPGVGFALETGHGTAAVRLHDGTFHHVALIEGDASYTTLMRRLATAPSNRAPDDPHTFWEKMEYLRARTQRLLNKLLGRPATPETAILASMVSRLLKITQTWLGDDHIVVGAVLSSPDLIDLTHEEIGDIFDYLKLKNLKIGPFSLFELYATSAAYAGYGKGLCESYTDIYECESEERNLPPQHVLHIDLNSESLSGTIKSLQSVRDLMAHPTFVDPSLGFGRFALATGEDTEDEQYWIAVTTRIRELVKSSQRAYTPQVSDLLLTGPFATKVRFRKAIKAALHDLVADEDVLVILENLHVALNAQEDWQSLFTFATARGAAEVAKRRQEGPVDCTQSDQCRQKRDRVHNERQPMLLNQQADALKT